ncbi:MAG TPA: hypothetical protein VFJ16_07190 [Longimicrobium sp.]|nr:hypothetical protein [Longimicrobium sp.]
MKPWEIFRFEAAGQLRRASTWFYFAVVLVLTFVVARVVYIPNARTGGYFFNAPFVIATVTLLGGMFALLPAVALAGPAAARDLQTRMHPLVFTAPIEKAAYLGGRFLAAFFASAVVLLAVPVGALLAAYLPGVEAELMGPFRPAAYVTAYLLIALPNAFVAVALGFALAALGRSATASYLGGVLLFFATILSWQLVAEKLGRWALARLLDPMALTVMAEMSQAWTAGEKNARLVGLQGAMISNRLLWLGIALGLLALTCVRFRLAHPVAGGWFSRRTRRLDTSPAGAATAPRARVDAASGARRPAPALPRVRRTFGAATHGRQVLAVAGDSFRMIVTGWGGVALAFLTLVLVLTGPAMAQHLGVPLFPATAHITAFIGDADELLWMIVPLLIVHYAGELVWRERDAGLGEIADAAPAPDWAALLGKFLGLALVLAALQALMIAAAMLVQAGQGYDRFEIGVYARIVLGVQLADLLLFAVLALAVQVMVDRKYVGHLVVLAAYGVMRFGPALGIGHNLLVYRSDPGWAYSDMRGFSPFMGPWLWFKLYWAAWALLLALAARLLWPRGTENGAGARLRLARGRFTRRVMAAASLAVALIVSLGGFIFYNTNVLNRYESADDGVERSAAYERRFGRYAEVPQPLLTGTALRLEIHPARRQVEIRGTYRLVNAGATPIDSIHLATSWDVETGAVTFDRPATRVLADEALGQRIYALRTPLQPGDSLRLTFAVRSEPHGFPNRGIDPSVAPNGTFFGNGWLPAIGYQSDRELTGAGERRAHGLAPRPSIPRLEDAAARPNEVRSGTQRIAFDAVVGTDTGQVAVAPGALRRTWTEGGRRFFHYAADAPIRNDFAIHSAAYAVREARWTGPSGQTVAIQVLHHPGHAWNVDRMIRGVRATLDYQTRWFGPYPQGQIRLVERPGFGPDLHASPVNIWYKEGFALFRPNADPRHIDFPFAVVAHEVAHQWWGNELMPANLEGSPLLTESLAWYSALGTVEQTYGRAHLERLLAMMREIYLSPRARAAAPLLRANDRFHAYRKGPFAMYALREYVGEARVNAALGRLLRQYGSGAPPLATSLDLYRELRAATPDSLHPLLHDLLEVNTYWELEARTVRAEPAAAGAWRVTLDVRARKVVVDTAGTQTEVPMNDPVEIGVYAAGHHGEAGAPLYLRVHRVRSGEQRITVTVPRKPSRAGIDPRNLLIDDQPDDNISEVTEPKARVASLRIYERSSLPMNEGAGREISPGAIYGVDASVLCNTAVLSSCSVALRGNHSPFSSVTISSASRPPIAT